MLSLTLLNDVSCLVSFGDLFLAALISRRAMLLSGVRVFLRVETLD